MIGTIVNVIAVVCGSIVGIFIHKHLPDKVTRIVFQAIGLFTIVLGISLAIKTELFLVMIFLYRELVPSGATLFEKLVYKVCIQHPYLLSLKQPTTIYYEQPLYWT